MDRTLAGLSFALFEALLGFLLGLHLVYLLLPAHEFVHLVNSVRHLLEDIVVGVRDGLGDPTNGFENARHCALVFYGCHILFILALQPRSKPDSFLLWFLSVSSLFLLPRNAYPIAACCLAGLASSIIYHHLITDDDPSWLSYHFGLGDHPVPRLRGE